MHAVVIYATDFVARGDTDVLFTLSGGAIETDGQSADPAVWSDWLAAWDSVSPEDERARAGDGSLDVQHGFRALHLFLERNYQPVAETPMSRVRDDCRIALSYTPEGTAHWDRWQEALRMRKDADISFRLTKP